MKIEVGKTYRTRGGELIRIAREQIPCSDGYPFETSDDEWYTSDGRFYVGEESPRDIVEGVTLLPDAPGIYDEAISARARMLGETATIARPQTASGIAAELDATQQRQRTEQRLIDAERGVRSLRRSAIYQAAATVLLAIAVAIFGMRTANARDLAWMPNDAGGEIVLTDVQTPECGDARVVVARAAGGKAFVGCYAYTDSGYVAARFGTDIRTWRLEDFRLFDSAPASRGTRL